MSGKLAELFKGTIGSLKVKGSLTQNFAWTSSTKLAASVLSIIITPILTRIYSPGDYGLFSVFSIIITNYLALSSLGYWEAMMIVKSKREFFQLFWLRICLVVITTVLFYFAINTFLTELIDIDIEQIEKTFKVNFFGTLNCIKAVEEYFKNKKSGQISIVSSIAGYRGLPNSTGYGPSKAALNNLAESLYFDFERHNVRVSLVSPGFIKTPMTDKNNFKMPFLKTAEFAADKIYNDLINNKNFEIHFPKELTLVLKLFRIFPYKLYFYLVKKLTKLQKK